MNKRILVAGNANYGLAKELYNLYPGAIFMSRSTGFDLTSAEGQLKASIEMLNCDVFINCSALWKFQQTVLLDKLYKSAVENNKRPHIICIGSTTDRVKKGGSWLYNAEKKALRDYCNTLGIAGVWEGKPKVTLISYGSLSNVSEKHPTRTCLDITVAASYIKWLIDQPDYICINEISIDPLQN
jgi:NADP-dependent 3-hydroxy acid dehydrogenase YdfG